MAFEDKKEFETSDPEDKFRNGTFPVKSADQEFSAEEFPDEEEEELSEEELAEEMRPFTLAEWQQSIPDYNADEFEEKLPERTRARWMEPVVSGLWGILLGAAIAGLLVDNQPRPQQVRTFFIFFLVLATLLSCVWHWFFVLRPKSIAKKINDEQEVNAVGSEPIFPNEELQRAKPVGAEPIHPK
jgi:hypothetical protein